MKILGVLLRIETLKTVKRRTFWVTVGLFAAFNVIMAVDNVNRAHRFPSYSYALPDSWPNILAGLASPTGFFIAVLIMRAGETARSLTEYFPANVSEALGDDLAHYPEMLASVNADRAGRGLAPREFLDVEVMVMAVLAYSTIFLLISFLSMRKRDL